MEEIFINRHLVLKRISIIYSFILAACSNIKEKKISKIRKIREKRKLIRTEGGRKEESRNIEKTK